jgi:hypothetical protein
MNKNESESSPLARRDLFKAATTVAGALMLGTTAETAEAAEPSQAAKPAPAAPQAPA